MGKAEPARANEVAPGERNFLAVDHMGKETNAGAAVVRVMEAGLGVQSRKGPCKQLVAWELGDHWRLAGNIKGLFLACTGWS